VNPTAEKRELKSSMLAGKSFVFTGTLARRTREEAGELVQQHDGKILNSVSKKTDFVVVGADPGSKAEKARELGVTILNEDEFEDILAGRRSVAAAPPEPPAAKKEPKKKKAPSKKKAAPES
jgi:DNA ligase (NAD+)